MNCDITFCNRECANKTCERNLSCDNKIIDIAKIKSLISVTNFAKCKDYISKEAEFDRE